MSDYNPISASQTPGIQEALAVLEREVPDLHPLLIGNCRKSAEADGLEGEHLNVVTMICALSLYMNYPGADEAMELLQESRRSLALVFMP